MVLGLSFDLYGRRLAACCSSGAVRVYESADGSPTTAWVPRGEGFNPGAGAVWRVAWAHPEFGNVVAVCGAATTMSVWEEQEAPDSAGAVVSRWQRRAELGDARAQVNDVEFAPRHLGLRLASGAQDALVRIYEVSDVMSITHWPLTDEFRGAESAADARGGPGAGAPAAAAASATSTAAAAAAAAAATAAGEGGAGAGASGVTCLSWCSSQFDPAMMVVGGAQGEVNVWGLSAAARKWVRMLALRRHEGGRVNDVAWAPNVGRSYHVLATAGSGVLCLWHLFPDSPTDGGEQAAAVQELQSQRLQQRRPNQGVGPGAVGGATDPRAAVARFVDGARARLVELFDDGVEVWRCEWNATGSSLASTTEDGRMIMRQATLSGEWAVVTDL